MSLSDRDPVRAVTDGGAQEREGGGQPAGPVGDTLAPLILVSLLSATFLTQFAWPGGAESVGLSAEALREGRWFTLVGHLFVDESLPHLAMTLALLNLGTGALAWRYGRSGYALMFLAFGLLGGAVHLIASPAGLLTGATAAACGLWGASARIPASAGRTQAKEEPLAPLRTAKPLRHAAAFLLGLLPVWYLTARHPGGPEAGAPHLAAFAAGLLLVGAWPRPKGTAGGEA